MSWKMISDTMICSNTWRHTCRTYHCSRFRVMVRLLVMLVEGSWFSSVKDYQPCAYESEGALWPNRTRMSAGGGAVTNSDQKYDTCHYTRMHPDHCQREQRDVPTSSVVRFWSTKQARHLPAYGYAVEGLSEVQTPSSIGLVQAHCTSLRKRLASQAAGSHLGVGM